MTLNKMNNIPKSKWTVGDQLQFKYLGYFFTGVVNEVRWEQQFDLGCLMVYGFDRASILSLCDFKVPRHAFIPEQDIIGTFEDQCDLIT